MNRWLLVFSFHHYHHVFYKKLTGKETSNEWIERNTKKERKKREREKTTGILIVSCLSCDVMILYRQKTLWYIITWSKVKVFRYWPKDSYLSCEMNIMFDFLFFFFFCCCYIIIVYGYLICMDSVESMRQKKMLFFSSFIVLRWEKNASSLLPGSFSSLSLLFGQYSS